MGVIKNILALKNLSEESENHIPSLHGSRYCAKRSEHFADKHFTSMGQEMKRSLPSLLAIISLRHEAGDEKQRLVLLTSFQIPGCWKCYWLNNASGLSLTAVVHSTILSNRHIFSCLFSIPRMTQHHQG
ncbi:uncharacterized protein LOC144297834 isoform X2 [Canis aureus]